MQLFKNVNIRWMANVWYFLAFSLLLAIIGWISVFQRGGFIMGIDFSGGTLVKVKFSQKPDLDRMRTLFTDKLKATEVARFDAEEKNIIQIRLKKVESEDTKEFQDLGEIVKTMLRQELDAAKSAGKQDLNQVGGEQLSSALRDSRVLENMNVLKAGASIEETTNAYKELGKAIIDDRTGRGGIFTSFDQLASVPGAGGPVREQLQRSYYLGSFTVLSIDSVGPKIGKELQNKARNAVLFSLLGMLVYIAFRFKLAYGIGAVVALFHDVLITLGLLSLFNKEISLVVVAALLTLIGYSINDTIVVFDRIRENIKFARNLKFFEIIDTSINQTLSRTIITSGLTFISVFCLWLLGGEALDGFSLVLVVGIIIGTYSSIAVASPLMYVWMKYFGSAKDKQLLHF